MPTPSPSTTAATPTATRPRPPRPLWAGLDYGPALVVLDPSPAAPRELPAAWRGLAQSYQLAWCAVPDLDSPLHAVEDVLETMADRRTRTQIVAHTDLVDVAVRAVSEFPEIVRSLVVVGAGRPEYTGVRTRVVGGSDADLADPAVVRDVLAALEPAAPVNVRLALSTTGQVSLGRSGAGRLSA